MAKANPCTRKNGVKKKRWPSEEAATFVAEWEAMRGHPEKRIYECPACGGWHVSTLRDKNSRRARGE